MTLHERVPESYSGSFHEIAEDPQVAKLNKRMGIGIMTAFTVILGAVTVKVILDASSYTPLKDGSFPVYQGVWTVFLFLLLFLASFNGTLAIILAKSKFATAKVLTSLVVGLTLLAISSGAINNFAYERWEKAITSWASDTYGIEAEYVTEYHYPGIVGQPATKYNPAVYIDPPEDIRYLTTKDGKYVAELIPPYYKGETVLPYTVSFKAPTLLEPKK